MDKINRLNMLISDADEAYKKSVENILDEILPCIDMDFRHEVAEKIYRDKHKSPDEIILMHDGRAFDNPALVDLLTERIQNTRKENEGLKPCIDTRYWCETCGSHSHEENPKNGYCFVCNTDNWEPENYRNI